MTTTLKFITATSLLTLLNACTWVQLSSAGEGVEIRTAAQVANCERLGVASSTTMDRLLVVDRNNERQQEELYTLARNEACLLYTSSTRKPWNWAAPTKVPPAPVAIHFMLAISGIWMATS